MDQKTFMVADTLINNTHAAAIKTGYDMADDSAGDRDRNGEKSDTGKLR